MSYTTFFEAKKTLKMVNTPVTDLRILLGSKWFLRPDLLAKRANIGYDAVINAANGKTLPAIVEKKLRRYLENYKGEIT